MCTDSCDDDWHLMGNGLLSFDPQAGETTIQQHTATNGSSNGNGHHSVATNGTLKTKTASSYEQERFEQINSKYVEETVTERQVRNDDEWVVDLGSIYWFVFLYDLLQIRETYQATNGSYKYHSVNLEKLPLPSTGGNVEGKSSEDRVLSWSRDYNCFTQQYGSLLIKVGNVPCNYGRKWVSVVTDIVKLRRGALHQRAMMNTRFAVDWCYSQVLTSGERKRLLLLNEVVLCERHSS